MIKISKYALIFVIGFFSVNSIGANLTPNDELTLEDLRSLNESQLYDLFQNGEALEIPEENTAIGERIEYTGLPLAEPSNDAANKPWELIWGGKTFYRDRNGTMKLDNKLLPRKKQFLGLNIDLITAIVSLDTSIEDGKSVILIDYGNAEVPLFRPVRDEIRLISAKNDLYIGRASAYIFPKTRFLKYLRSVTLISLVNNLLDNGYNCKKDNGGQYPEGDYCFAIWFALQKK